jgi:NAD(P)-dependent dehydrogenase (short-subunit alcohol dehydrogenase family)
MNLKDKVIVITGGSKGLGKTLAEFLKKEGSKIIICSKNEIEIRQVAKDLRVDYFLGDVTKEQDMINLVEFSIQKFGSLDIWVNNAGILYGNIENNEYFDTNKAKSIFDVNFFGVVFGMRSALKQMQKKKQGLIMALDYQNLC